MLRWRIRFSRGEELKYLSHLDLVRLWERGLRRAGVALAYSQGFSPHPHLSMVAPLPLGFTSRGEVLEVYLKRPQKLLAPALERALPPGMKVLGMEPVPLSAPSLPSQVRSAQYRVEVAGDRGQEEVLEAIRAFLAKESLPWQHRRDKEIRHYDLRALVLGLGVGGWDPQGHFLEMKLVCSPQASGRPEQVALALGLKPLAIERLGLELGL